MLSDKKKFETVTVQKQKNPGGFKMNASAGPPYISIIIIFIK